MASLLEIFSKAELSVVVAVGGVVLPIVVYTVYRRWNRSQSRAKYPRDTVIMIAFRRGTQLPHWISPFPLKLETYFKLAKIPYKVVFPKHFKNSPKKKMPWIEYNGQRIGDTSLIIEFLNEKFQVDLNKHLSPAERGISRAFQKMVDENTYWGHTYWLFLDQGNPTLAYTSIQGSYIFKKYVTYYHQRKMKGMLYSHGIGRHSKEEIYSIMEKDLRAISEFLGDKKFLHGDEPCEADCAIFGQLAQLLWCQYPGSPQQKLIKGELKNLENYCYTMKERFWPDWEQCILGDNAPLSLTHRPSDPHVITAEE